MHRSAMDNENMRRKHVGLHNVYGLYYDRPTRVKTSDDKWYLVITASLNHVYMPYRAIWYRPVTYGCSAAEASHIDKRYSHLIISFYAVSSSIIANQKIAHC